MRFTKTVATLLLAFGLVTVSQAADTNWTEVDVVAFDKIDGDFAPRLTGSVVNFIAGKGIGAFLGQDNAIGPLVLWRVWQRPVGDLNFSIFTVASTDVSGVAENEPLFNNATFGLEPRIGWTEFGNAEIGLGVLSTTFVEGQKAEWTPYVKIAFRP